MTALAPNGAVILHFHGCWPFSVDIAGGPNLQQHRGRGAKLAYRVAEVAGAVTGGAS